MRIHIGRISPALAGSSGDLEKLLDKHGRRTSPISLHKKPLGEYYFAFVDMDLDAKQYSQLCSQLNSVTFKQSKLEIKQAKPDFKQVLEKEKELPAKPALNPDQYLRFKSRGRREIDLFHGRNRESKKIREFPTFRVLINHKLRKPRLRKTKLWGLEKRPLNKLTDHFVNGEWRDADDHAIEVVSTMQDEHARDSELVKTFSTNAAYLSDSDFEEFKQNANTLEDGYSDDEIEIVRDDNQFVAQKHSYSDDEDESAMSVDKPNSVETLKSAFEVDKPFTLFGPVETAEETPKPVTEIEPAPRKGLFFIHKSPYLRSQAQASQLVSVFDSSAWEKEFFERRSEFKGDMKKRHRDAVRIARKMGKKQGE
ncbi:hypothetical protein DASB73_015400 [Starmerella bacillaris]|uniref:RRM domain-containing protein n=1 Tax=Starmerella bacillaris TaxID=1247836 RepID=A0AAV5RH95_STABA|nr:hypothetical protein DASB73_015400 [Starmerella bacillaris]